VRGDVAIVCDAGHAATGTGTLVALASGMALPKPSFKCPAPLRSRGGTSDCDFMAREARLLDAI